MSLRRSGCAAPVPRLRQRHCTSVIELMCVHRVMPVLYLLQLHLISSRYRVGMSKQSMISAHSLPVRRRRRPPGMMPRDARYRYKDGAMGAIKRCSKLLQARLHSLWSRAPSLITHPPRHAALVQRIRIRPLHRARRQPRCRGVFISAAAD
jgi:hypothetical protein